LEVIMRRASVPSVAFGCVLLAALVEIGAATAAGQPTTNGVCVALVTPTVEGVSGSATQVGIAVRDLFASFLTGPSLRTMPLEARLVSQAMEEARQKQCANVLLASVTMKRSGHRGLLARTAGQAGSNVAWQLPYGGSAGSAIARGAAIAAAETMSALASSTKAKDEVRLEYHLLTDGATRIPSTTKQAKAKADGEDLLTGLVQQASEAVAGAVAKPQTR
jgi:hypothetical protein